MAANAALLRLDFVYDVRVDDEAVISPEMRDAIFRHGQVVSGLSAMTTELDAMENTGAVDAAASPLFSEARDRVKSSHRALVRNEMEIAEQMLSLAQGTVERLRRGER